MQHLITTLGPKRADELEMILPHEHLFADLRSLDQPGTVQVEPGEVMAQVLPEITRASQAGISVLVDGSTVGVGRRIDILKAVSEMTGFPIVAPTGIYREPWVPVWAHEASEDELFIWMQDELEGEIENSGVQAGFIQVSAGDEGLSTCETKILCAAIRAAAESDAAISSQTSHGWVVREELAIVEERGYAPNRFIWIHANQEPDSALNLEMARRGAWIEYDGIGSTIGDDFFIQRIQRMLDAGLEDHLLVSQDRLGYPPAQQNGGVSRPFTYLVEVFLPKLRQAGIDEKTIRRLVLENPFKALAR